MKKKTYQQPRLRVIEIETTEIVCTSNPNEPLNEPLNERLEEGDPIFG